MRWPARSRPEHFGAGVVATPGEAVPSLRVCDYDEALNGLRVLVVEDQGLIAMHFSMMLAELGCLVLGPVPKVRSALSLLERESPDFALLDVNLGHEDSTPIASELKRRGVPYACVTAYRREDLPSTELRDAPVVPKPCTADALRRVLVGDLCQ